MLKISHSKKKEIEKNNIYIFFVSYKATFNTGQ